MATQMCDDTRAMGIFPIAKTTNIPSPNQFAMEMSQSAMQQNNHRKTIYDDRTIYMGKRFTVVIGTQHISLLRRKVPFDRTTQRRTNITRSRSRQRPYDTVALALAVCIGLHQLEIIFVYAHKMPLKRRHIFIT